MMDDVDDSSVQQRLHAELVRAGAALRRRSEDLADSANALGIVRGTDSRAIRPAPPLVLAHRRARHRLRLGAAAVAAMVLAVSLGAGVAQQQGVESTAALATLATDEVGVTGQVTPSMSTSLSLDTLPSTETTARSCTYTDPAMRPISLARALGCPDGTEVFVSGFLVIGAGGDQWLCDERATGSDPPCAGAGLRLVGDPRQFADGFVGIKQGDSLLNTSAGPPPQSTWYPSATTVPDISPVFPTTTDSPPTVVTLVLAGPSPMPSNEHVNLDLEDHCTRLYDIVADMALGPYVPAVAKALGLDDGTDNKVGCEMYFGTPPQPGAVIHDDAFVIALTSEALPHRNVTNDADETLVSLTSGRVAFVDPTGDDGVGYDDVRVVTVPQPDGGVAFVMGFNGTPLDVTLTIADEFDRALAATNG